MTFRRSVFIPYFGAMFFFIAVAIVGRVGSRLIPGVSPDLATLSIFSEMAYAGLFGAIVLGLAFPILMVTVFSSKGKS